MFIELIDALRCPADHPPSTLVAALDRIEDRDVRQGMLGCPVCRSEFAIRDGQLYLATNAMPAPPTRPLHPADDALRLAASLDLRSEDGFAILRGPWCALAEAMSEIVPTHLVLLDPPFDTPAGPGRTIIHAGGVVPFAPATSNAAAVDERAAVFALAATVRAGGRVVGPPDVPPPSMVKELVRDDRWWVGEVENTTAPIPLRRAPAR